MMKAKVRKVKMMKAKVRMRIDPKVWNTPSRYFALKVVRKKQRIFHNKQILRPLEYTQKKLLFPHFSKNT